MRSGLGVNSARFSNRNLHPGKKIVLDQIEQLVIRQLEGNFHAAAIGRNLHPAKHLLCVRPACGHLLWLYSNVAVHSPLSLAVCLLGGRSFNSAIKIRRGAPPARGAFPASTRSPVGRSALTLATRHRFYIPAKRLCSIKLSS
jgi:hypothetical protein